MKLNLWISLPLSMICVLANAQGTAPTTTTATATTTTNTTAKAKVTPVTTAPAAATSTAAPKKDEVPSVKFGLTYEGEYSLQAQTQPDGKREQGLSHTFTGTVGYGDFNILALMIYDQDLLDSNSNKSNSWSDATLGLSKNAW